MALPSSGQITLKQINTEFGGSNTLKSNATIANISTSNVGCKSFYGLSSAIDPVYIQPVPVTQADVDGWNNQVTGATLQVYSGKLRTRDDKAASKIIITTPIVLINRPLVCTPGLQYTISFNVGGSNRVSGWFRVFDSLVYGDGSGSPAHLASLTLPNSGYSAQSFTFTAPNADIVIAARFEGPNTTTTTGSSVTLELDSIRVEL